MHILLALWTVISVTSIIFTVTIISIFVANLRKEIMVKDKIVQLHQSCKMVYIEHVNGWSYMYDRLTDQFICSGETDDIVIDRARNLFPTYRFDIRPKSNNDLTILLK